MRLNGSFIGNRNIATAASASGMWNMNDVFLNESVYNKWPGGRELNTGRSPAGAAPSALVIKQTTGTTTDGVYYINLPTVGPTPVYCLMDPKWDGGGWMMAMKATTGTTFNYSSSHWTTITTLSANDTTRNNNDAKYHTMNYFPAKDIMAVWPDITTGSGGSLPGLGSWIWLQNNFTYNWAPSGGTVLYPSPLINFFSNANLNYAGEAYNFNGYSGWTGVTTVSGASGNSPFSSAANIHFYGFNFIPNPNWGTQAKIRWGFGWSDNSEGDYASNTAMQAPTVDYLGNPITDYSGSIDVSSGIGLDSAFGNYSAGDKYNCCINYAGINRSARVEIYIR
jgi:hypothetical protein